MNVDYVSREFEIITRMLYPRKQNLSCEWRVRFCSEVDHLKRHLKRLKSYFPDVDALSLFYIFDLRTMERNGGYFCKCIEEDLCPRDG